MKTLFVFDLDGTLGWKTSPFPDITKSNADFIKELASSDENFLCFATGRPRTQVVQGMAKGGISEEEIYKLFPGRVYEDGLFVEAGPEVIYNAVNESPEMFSQLKKAFFDSETSQFLNEKGFFLVSGMVIRQSGEGFLKLDYKGKEIGRLEVPQGLTPLYQQGNDVRETYKLPENFLDGDLNKQIPIFQELSKILTEHLDSRFPGWQNSAELVTWRDSTEIYPRLDTPEVFVKGVGLGRVLREMNAKDISKVYLCCDSRNDISLVKWVAEKFPNYHVVCPSNVNYDLRSALVSGNYNHTILKQDCTKFAEGLKALLKRSLNNSFREIHNL